MFNTVMIIGMGLMGSSLARAIKKRGIAKKIIGNDNNEKDIRRALDTGVIDEELKRIGDTAIEADLIIICTPLQSYETIGKALSKFAKPDCIVTDVGSVKGTEAMMGLYNQLTNDQKLNLVPGHPIAGSQKSGFSAGTADLYSGKIVILTPLKTTSSKAVIKLTKFWEMVGCRVRIMDGDNHDEIFGTVSHTPQLLSYIFADMLWRQKSKIISPDENFNKFSRLCTSSGNIWQDIFHLNKKNILKTSNGFHRALKNLIKNLEEDNLQRVARIISHADVLRGVIMDNLSYEESPLSPNAESDLQTVIPKIITAVYLNAIPVDYIAHAGPGFLDFTRVAITEDAKELSAHINSRKAELIPMLNVYLTAMDVFCDTLKKGTKPEIFQKINNATERFLQIRPKA